MKSLYKQMYAVGALACAVQSFSLPAQADEVAVSPSLSQIGCQRVTPYAKVPSYCKKNSAHLSADLDENLGGGRPGAARPAPAAVYWDQDVDFDWARFPEEDEPEARPAPAPFMDEPIPDALYDLRAEIFTDDETDSGSSSEASSASRSDSGSSSNRETISTDSDTEAEEDRQMEERRRDQVKNRQIEEEEEEEADDEREEEDEFDAGI